MVYSHRRSKDDLLLILYYIGCCSPWGRKELDTTEQLIWADIGWWIQLAVQEADIHNDTHLSTRSFLSPILSFATCNVLSWTLFSILLHFLNFFFQKRTGVLFIYFTFGCAGSSLRGVGFLWFLWVGGYSLVAVCGLLTVVGSLVEKHMGLVAPCHVEFPGPGNDLMSPALASGFLTTEPPGKSFKKKF